MFLFVPPFPVSLVGNNFGLVFRVRVDGAFRYHSTVILQSLFWIMLFQCWALYDVFKQMIECHTFISWCIFNLRQAVKRRKRRCIRDKQDAKSNPAKISTSSLVEWCCLNSIVGCRPVERFCKFNLWYLCRRKLGFIRSYNSFRVWQEVMAFNVWWLRL